MAIYTPRMTLPLLVRMKYLINRLAQKNLRKLYVNIVYHTDIVQIYFYLAMTKPVPEIAVKGKWQLLPASVVCLVSAQQVAQFY